MSQDSVFSTGRCHYTPRSTTSAMTLWSEETALRGQLRRLPRCGKGGAADRGAALHEVEFPIKRKTGQTCASLRPGRLLTTTPRARSSPAFPPLKRPSAAGSSASRPGRRLSCRPFAPPPRKAAAPGRSGQVRGASRPRLTPAPARPRAPLTAVGGKARANDRGLARK